MQYIPVNGLYVYFRCDKQQIIMVVTNSGTTQRQITVKSYDERTSGFSKLKNVITGQVMPLQDFSIKPNESLVFELEK